MERFELKGGATLNMLKTDKFKTLTLGVNIYRPIEGEASLNALLAAVLKNASEKYPEKITLEKHLEWMFGASFGAGIRKKSETQVIGFEISAPTDKYTGENMTKLLAEFLYEIIFNPKTDGTAFDETVVAVEKENLKNRIAALKNDKKEYASQRMTEEMCKGEPYAVYEYGSEEELSKITAETLKAHYDGIIKNSKIDIFAIGQCDRDEIIRIFGEIQAKGEMRPAEKSPEPGEVRYVFENMDVTQGKLVIGMKTSCESYYDLMLMNSIFGSGTHSKLFNNVREKLSLAYYAYSRLVRGKGLINVSTGIEFDKYEETKNEIFNQLEEMKKGNIADFETDAAKKSLINAYSSLADTPSTLIDFYVGQQVAGVREDIEEIIENIRKVTREGIIAAAKTVNPDTVYFLKGME